MEKLCLLIACWSAWEVLVCIARCQLESHEFNVNSRLHLPHFTGTMAIGMCTLHHAIVTAASVWGF